MGLSVGIGVDSSVGVGVDSSVGMGFLVCGMWVNLRGVCRAMDVNYEFREGKHCMRYVVEEDTACGM